MHDSSFGRASTAGAEQKDMSPFSRMEIAAGYVSDLRVRANRLADRLTGPAPIPLNSEKVAQGAPAPAPIFHSLRAMGDNICLEVEDAIAAIERIERALP